MIKKCIYFLYDIRCLLNDSLDFKYLTNLKFRHLDTRVLPPTKKKKRKEKSLSFQFCSNIISMQIHSIHYL